MNNNGTIELDVHGMTRYQAQIAIDAKLQRVSSGTYRICIIHGFNYGTSLRDFIREHYKDHPKVRRIELGLNRGITELVLREY